MLPSLRDNLSYDILRDFEPVGMAAVFPIVLVVNPSMPVNSVSELIAYAKAQPGKLSFSSVGTGGGTHLAGELFNAMAGTRIQHVPYRGSAPAMQDLVGGQVQLMFADGPSAVPQLKAGKVRALGVGNLRRSALLPDAHHRGIRLAGLRGLFVERHDGAARHAGGHRRQGERGPGTGVVGSRHRQQHDRRGRRAKPGTPRAFGDFVAAEIGKWRE